MFTDFGFGFYLVCLGINVLAKTYLEIKKTNRNND